MSDITKLGIPTRFVEHGTQLPHGPDDRIKLEQLVAGVPPAGLEVGRVTYEPGADTGHGSHPGQEFLVLIEGTLEVSVADERYHLEAGNAIHFDATRPHRGCNTGQATSIAIYVLLREV